MKKFLASLLAVAMVVSLVACGGKKDKKEASNLDNVDDFVEEGTEKTQKKMDPLDDPSKAKLKETLVIGNVRDLTTVNPYDSNTIELLNVLKMTHSHLLKLDPETYEILNDLATDYEQIDDLNWKFSIRNDAKFHNGEPLTAADIKYSFDRMKEYSYTKAKIEFIEEVKILDDYTVQFVLNKNSQDFLNILTYPNICIVNQKAIEADEVMGPAVGSGPYIIDDWELGDHTTLVRNEEYYGELPLTKKWEIKLITEDSARVIALENGETDFCIQPPVTENDHIADGKNTTLLSAVGNKLIYGAINVQHDILNNKQVRQAIAHAINRENIVIAAKDGYAVVANSVLSPKTPFYNKDQKALDYDPEKAKELLKEAGYENGFEFTISFQGATFRTIAQLIQEDLKAIGITVNCEELEASSLKTKMQAGEHDMVIYNWGPSPGEGTDITVRSLFYSGSGSNRQMLADPTVDDIIDRASVETDETKRQDLYYELQSWMVDNGGMIPLYYEMVTMGVNSNLHNFIMEVSEQHDYTYAYAEDK